LTVMPTTESAAIMACPGWWPRVDGDLPMTTYEPAHHRRTAPRACPAGPAARRPPRTRPSAVPGRAGGPDRAPPSPPGTAGPGRPARRSPWPTPARSPAGGTSPAPAGNTPRPGTAGPAAAAAPSSSAPGCHRPAQTAGTALTRPDDPDRTPPRP